MIVVIGLGTALAALITALMVLAVNNLRQAGLQGRGEQALHAADASLDWVLEELRTSDGTTPQDPALDADPDTPPIDPFTDDKQERDAVLAAADALIATSPSRLTTGPSGQWLALRPEDTDGTDLAGIAYGVGYMPSRANPDRIRVLRAEYQISILTVPSAAILANGNVRFTSEVDISGSIHTNGNIYNSSSFDATGTATSSGSTCESCTSGGAPGSGPGQPAQEVPPVHPRDYYDLGTSGSERWDLCPDGTVRLPASASSPCTGTVVSPSGTFRGWSFTSGGPNFGNRWNYGTPTRYNGIYYVYQGNAIVASVGTTSNPWRATVITETERDHDFEETTPAASHCPHVGGDIVASSAVAIKAHPEAENVVMVAGRDITSSSAFDVIGPPSNLIYAHEQIRFSSAVDLDAGLIAENACNTPGSSVDSSDAILMSSSVDITFDGSGGSGAENTVKTTIWSEI
jgi:hypothetical protein